MKMFKHQSVSCDSLRRSSFKTKLKYNHNLVENVTYGELLNRLRIGCMTDEDVKTLNGRLINKDGSRADMTQIVDYFLRLEEEERRSANSSGKFTQTVCLFPTCDLVDEFNSRIISQLNFDVVEIEAILPDDENRPGFKKRKPAKKVTATTGTKKRRTRETAGLHLTLRLAVGCRVMLRRNLNQALGLINGAIGTVKEFRYVHNNMVSSVVVDFESINQMGIRIDRVKADYEISRNLFIKMSQLPLSLSYGLTIHKSQMSLFYLFYTIFVLNMLCELHLNR